ncbi:MgtC/SapB family protein [Polaromonas sp. YR568]|uniref:MgtC/SapB family protein n=1 Tax=Polaromonas sp. YR568 TaxID=1855301 RepID=UPI003137C463
MSGWWTEVGTTLAAEFSDIADASELTIICTRLLMAALLGGLLGFEREHSGKAAGIRTHMLVCMGAALFVLVPSQVAGGAGEMGRVIQGIAAGIGFIGAGTILKGAGDESQVKGLTTAAGLWLTAAIGVAVGTGLEATAVLSTLLALLILGVVPWLATRLLKKKDESDR